MTKPLKTQFVIADGSRARWVHRTEANDFVTERELNAGHGGHKSGGSVSVHAPSGHTFRVDQRTSAAREVRVRFAHEVADAISAQAAQGAFDRLALVAPPRILSAIRDRMSVGASAKLARTLAKDLTKAPDHELGAWLGALDFA